MCSKTGTPPVNQLKEMMTRRRVENRQGEGVY
jgi:hypothetical protein